MSGHEIENESTRRLQLSSSRANSRPGLQYALQAREHGHGELWSSAPDASLLRDLAARSVGTSSSSSPLPAHQRPASFAGPMAQSIGLVTAPSSDSINHHRYCSADAEVQTIQAALARNDFRTAIAAAFHLPTSDHFVYHAIASVTLRQVQSAVDAGAANGLCDWYVDHNGKHVRKPLIGESGASLTTQTRSSAFLRSQTSMHTSQPSPPPRTRRSL